MPPTYFWTEAEKKFIAEHAGKLTARQIAECLDRTRFGVLGMAKKIGVPMGMPPTNLRDSKVRHFPRIGFIKKGRCIIDSRQRQLRRERLDILENAPIVRFDIGDRIVVIYDPTVKDSL